MSQTKPKILTRDKIVTRLPKDCFSFAKDEKERKPEDALGLDLSELGASGLEQDALKPFAKLRRLTLKGNHITSLSVGALPSTLSYLDISRNPELNDLGFLKGLKSLTTLILSECTGAGEVFNLEGDSFADCSSLKVLVIDRCNLKGTLNLANTTFASALETLIVSHNDLKKIDLKHASNLTKLSASHNSSLMKVKHVPDRTIAEIRLASCPSLESLHFLSKRQSKLALLDLSSSLLVKRWSDLQSLLCVDSLLTLSLKGSPLCETLAKSREEYERQCLKNLKTRKLRTLDYSTLKVKIPADEVQGAEEDDGEDFSTLLAQDKESDEEDEPKINPKGKKTATKKSSKKRTGEERLADSGSVQDERMEDDAIKRNKQLFQAEDTGLFEGASSKW